MTHCTQITLGEHLRSKPFTLCMSAGFFGFFAHGGMYAALRDAGVTPRRIVGASAGALIGGCLAADVPLDDIQDRLFHLERGAFWDPWPGPGLLRGKRLDRTLRAFVPTVDIQDLRIPFACSVWAVRGHRTRVCDHGDLVRGIRASAAFPGMFQPVRIDNRWCLDGGIADRPGFAALQEGENTLYHHLSTRSPWRQHAPAPPRVSQYIHVLDLGAFERLGPFSLSKGPDVWRDAYVRTQNALDGPVESQNVR